MKIALFVAREIQYFGRGFFSFDSYVYYLTRSFITWTYAFNFCLKEEIQCKSVETINSKADSGPPQEINDKDQESDKDRQQQMVGKKLFDKLPDEILEMILMNVTNLHAINAPNL